MVEIANHRPQRKPDLMTGTAPAAAPAQPPAPPAPRSAEEIHSRLRILKRIQRRMQQVLRQGEELPTDVRAYLLAGQCRFELDIAETERDLPPAEAHAAPAPVEPSLAADDAVTDALLAWRVNAGLATCGPPRTCENAAVPPAAPRKLEFVQPEQAKHNDSYQQAQENCAPAGCRCARRLP